MWVSRTAPAGVPPYISAPGVCPVPPVAGGISSCMYLLTTPTVRPDQQPCRFALASTATRVSQINHRATDPSVHMQADEKTQQGHQAKLNPAGACLVRPSTASRTCRTGDTHKNPQAGECQGAKQPQQEGAHRQTQGSASAAGLVLCTSGAGNATHQQAGSSCQGRQLCASQARMRKQHKPSVRC